MSHADLQAGLEALLGGFAPDPKRFRPAEALAGKPNSVIAVRAALNEAIAQLASGLLPDFEALKPIEKLRLPHRSAFLRALYAELAPPEIIDIDSTTDLHSVRTAGGRPLSPACLQTLLDVALTDSREVRSYTLDLLRSGHFVFPHPEHGGPCNMLGSLLVIEGSKSTVRPVIFYHGGGENPFFCLEHPLRGGIMGLFMPAANLYVATPRSRNQASVDLLRAFMLTYAKQTTAYLGSSETRGQALLIGANEHLGHTFLNEYDAVDQCSRMGELDDLKAVIRGWVGFVPHGDLFPELCELPVYSVVTPSAAFLSVAENNLLAVRPTSGALWMGRHLVRRFHRIVNVALPRPLRHSCIPRIDNTFPLIWFEVRSNDRYWKGQCSGIANVMKMLRRDFPNVGLVLAGWSLPADGALREFDRRSIEQDRLLTREVELALDQDICCFDITGQTTQEKIEWAKAIDAYVAVFSSGFILPQIIGRKPGILYSNQYYSELLLSESGPSSVAFHEGGVPTYVLCPDFIGDEDPTLIKERRSFDMRWEPLHQGLKWLVQAHTHKQPGSPASTEIRFPTEVLKTLDPIEKR